MDYFQGVVADYLAADKAMFVKPECCIQLDRGETPQPGRHWYCDVLAVRLREPRAVYLCEVSYSRSLKALFDRLSGWSANWDEVLTGLHEQNGVDQHWTVTPWAFVLRRDREKLAERMPAILELGSGGVTPMPSPLITSLEDVGPWQYGSPHELPGPNETVA